jgi:SAM-dependent methyltransferase
MRTEFTSNQFSQIYPDGIENHWWHLARSQVVANELSRRCPGQPVLDIGCARGVTLLHLRRRGVDCYGVEPGDVAPLREAEAFVFKGVSAGDLSPAERERFAVVMLLDVIEHLPNPVGFLESIAAGYPNLSHVIVTVPARPELWTNYDDFNGHYRRYTPDMICEIADRLAWRLAGQTYFFRLLYPPLWFLSRTRSPRSTRISPPGVRAKPAHRALARLMLLEQRAPLRGVPGSSILASFAVKRDATRSRKESSQTQEQVSA